MCVTLYEIVRRIGYGHRVTFFCLFFFIQETALYGVLFWSKYSVLQESFTISPVSAIDTEDEMGKAADRYFPLSLVANDAIQDTGVGNL
jgi:hypothetical protein